MTAPTAEALPLQSARISEVVAALVKARAAFGPAVKDATADTGQYSYSYLTLARLTEVTDQPLSDNGLIPLNQVYSTGDGMFLLTRIAHTSGEWLGSRYPIRPTKPDPQGVGSAISYARRYSLMSLLGLAAEDDDGAAASTPPRQAAAKTATVAAPTVPAVRGEIVTVLTGRGMSRDEIADEYSLFTQGETIQEATVPQLRAFAASMKVTP